MMRLKRHGAFWLTFVLLGCVVAGPASAGSMVRMSDQELDEVSAAGLFFELNLQSGFVRVTIASLANQFSPSSLSGSGSSGTGSPTSTSSSPTTLNGAPVLSGPLGTIVNAGNVTISGSAQQNLQAVGAVNAAGSIVQLLINILVVNIQNNPGTLNIMQPQVAGVSLW